MENEELQNLIGAWIILSVVIALPFLLEQQWESSAQAIFFALIILIVAVGTKKVIASMLDLNAVHRIWHMDRYRFHPKAHFKNEIPTGIIIPLAASLISIGKFFLLTPLTYEARAMKHRAAKRHGFYSFAEVTDWHNGLIGAAGTVATLILAIVGYLINQEALAKFATFYAAANLIPFSSLDGTQVFFGSRVLYATLVTVTLIFFLYALLLV